MMKKGKQAGKGFMVFLLYGLVAIGLVCVIRQGGEYPVGNQIYQYIYRAKILLENIKEGNFFPLYDSLWFNGEQLLRYVEPLPVAILTGCMAVFGGSSKDGYLLCVGLLYFFSTFGWVYMGEKIGRRKTGIFLGALWFFMPNNMHTLFLEGNLAEATAMIFLPFLLGNAYRWFSGKERCRGVLAGILFSEFLIASCSIRFAIFTALAVLLYGIITALMEKSLLGIGYVVAALVSGILLFGIWWYPSLYGDGTDTLNAAVMSHYFQDALVSLNPFYRMDGNDQHDYFGLAAFLVAVFGLVAGKKKTRSGYLAALILFLGTTGSAYVILSNLPGKRYLWMSEYISMALCLILLSFMYWRSLKRFFYLLCAAFLLLDAIPSVWVNQGEGYYTADEQIEIFEKATLLDKARSMTKQRMLFLDGDLYETAGAYAATMGSNENDLVAQTSGSGWQYSATSENIMDLNEALEGRHYDYLFDRLVMLGTDTVLIYTDAARYLAKDMDRVIAAAEDFGYDLKESKGKYYLFHCDAPNTFGVVSNYSSIGIGTSAKLLSYSYVDMIRGSSDQLDDYTYEELKDYDLVYLSGFGYNDKEKAEQLVLRLSKSGVRIVVDGSGVPTDEHTGIQGFLGVTCQTINFENGYPILYYNDEEVVCKLFPSEEDQWKTVALNGLDQVDGYLYDNGVQMAFAGAAVNENIRFVGISLPYHYYRTLDESGSKVVLDDLLKDCLQQIPEHTIVPLSVAWDKDSITITSEEDQVNTTLAYTDNIKGNKDCWQQGHQIYVNKGETRIQLTYPYLGQGALITAAGILMAVLLLSRKTYGSRKE